MKWLSFLAVLPSLSLAFQQAAMVHRRETSLNFLPANFQRAEQCATGYETCDLNEMEELANGTQLLL